jgi:hypothetical protein
MPLIKTPPQGRLRPVYLDELVQPDLSPSYVNAIISECFVNSLVQTLFLLEMPATDACEALEFA